MKIDKTLDSITRIIVRCCNPDKIILFGSYAKKAFDKNSDLDILVIGEFKKSKYLRAREVRDVLSEFPIRIDLHMLTSNEINSCTNCFSYLHSYKSNSICLFEKPITM